MGKKINQINKKKGKNKRLGLTTFIQVGATQFHLLATFSVISL